MRHYDEFNFDIEVIATYDNPVALHGKNSYSETQERFTFSVNVPASYDNEYIVTIGDTDGLLWYIAWNLISMSQDGDCHLQGDLDYLWKFSFCSNFTEICNTLDFEYDSTRNAKLHFNRLKNDELQQAIIDENEIASKVEPYDENVDYNSRILKQVLAISSGKDAEDLQKAIAQYEAAA